MALRRRDAARVAAALLATLALTGLLASGVTAGSLAGGESTPAGSTATAGGTVSVADPTGPTVDRTGTAVDGPALAQAVDADRTRIRIDLRPDGDAHWTVELWTRLEDDADEEAFADLQADVANDSEPYASDFRQRMNGSVAAASDATGREMAIENVAVSTRTEGVPSSYGVLAYGFEWTNFAAVDGDRLRAGDAVDAFLLEESVRLTVAWPEGYRVDSVRPAADDRTEAAVVWQGGETDFVAGQPRLVVTDAPADEGSLLPLLVGALAVLAVLLALGWLVRTGRLRVPRGALGGDSRTGAGDAGGVTGADAGRASPASGAVEADGTGGDEAGRTGSAGAGGDVEDGDGAAADDGPPPELLSNEEQVLRLLEERGGRTKQQQVVAELGWTEAKTSQVVTGMREDGRIEVFRIGRENVLALPGEADL